MRVTLVYPPNRNVPASPFGALPLLAGCLGAEGHAATIVDANLEVFDRLVSRESVEAHRAHFDSVWSRLRSRARLSLHEARLLQSMARFGTVPMERLLEAEEAARTLRDPVLFADPERVNWAYDTIALSLWSLYAVNPLYWPYRVDANDAFFDALADGADNPVAQIVEAVVIDQILDTRPDLVALSIPFNDQTFEAFALLSRLKARAPELPVIVGGAIVTGYAERLASDPRFYRYADFAMTGEAEHSFPTFCTALEEGTDLAQVPNLWRRVGESPRPPERTEFADLNAAPAPDFSTVPVGRYLLPTTIVNYQTSRGCYYKKCTFCSPAIKANFRFRRAELVISDLLHIQRQTGQRHFIFWDPLTSPRTMKAVARWNRERPAGERIFWGAETKFEKIFTDPRFTDLLAEGGAKFMQFGYESGSQRVLDRMAKGNDLARVDGMLECLEQSGIAVSVQWFIGFPGATEEEDRESYRYLHRHRKEITLSSYMGEFNTVPGDDIFRSGGDLYDIDIFLDDNGGWDYRHRDGENHYDRRELNAAYQVRGDAENVTRMAFYVYLTDHPVRVRAITNWQRGGALPERWSEVAQAVPFVPDGNYVATWDFDVVTDPLGQGFDQEGGNFPAGSSHTFHVAETRETVVLDERDRALLVLIDGRRTAEEIVTQAARDTGELDELRPRLLGMVRRGLAVVPLAELAEVPVSRA